MAGEAQKLLGHLLRLTGQANSDAALVARWAQQKDQDAFATLVTRHGPMVLGVCRRVLGDWQHAEDAFQATFLVLARKAATLRPPHALPAYLYRVALRIARKARTTGRCNTVPVHPDAAQPIDPQPHALDALSGRELLAMVDAEVARLPEVYRLPVLLCVLQERSVEEAARILDWSTGSVRGRLARGRQMLRQRLMDRGLTSLGGPLALLAPARVPQQLLSATMRNLTSAAPVAVNALAAGTSVGLGIKVLCVVGLVTAVGLGAGWPLLQAPDSSAGIAAAPPALVKKETRRDLYGDPLPEGAVARLGPQQRFHYEGYPRRLIYTPDGKTLLGYTNSGVQLWDAVTGKEKRRFAVRVTGFQVEMDLSKDGSTLAICNGAEDEETKVSLWDLRSGRNTANFSLPDGQGHNAIMTHVRFAPDGKSLAVTWIPQEDASKGKVAVFDVATGGVQASLGNGDPSFNNLAFTPDGKVLAIAVGKPKRAIQLWDTASWKFIRVLGQTVAADGVLSMTFSPDGKSLALANHRVVMIDVATGKESEQTRGPKRFNYIEGLAFSADGKTLACADVSGQVVAWQGTTAKVLRAKQERNDHVALALSPDGKTVAVGNGISRMLRLWDVASGKELLAEYQERGPGSLCMALTPDGKTLVTVAQNGQIDLWDTARWQHRGTLPGKGKASTLSFSADGKKLAAVTWDAKTRKVDIWEFASGIEAATITIPGTGFVRKAVLSPDGRKLSILETAAPENCFYLRHWDLATRKQESSWKIPLKSLQESSILPAHLTQDGKTVFVASGEGQAGVHVYNAVLGRKRFLPIEGEGTAHLAPSPDARVVASWIFNEYWVHKPSCPVRLSEVLTGTDILVLKGNSESVATAAWSADGRLLATGDQRPDRRLASSDQTIRLWDAASGKELARFSGFKSDVSTLTFAPDGGRLFAALDNGTILVWDTARAARGILRAQHVNEDELHACWSALAESRAAKAYPAMWTLIGAPESSVPLLRSRLKPAAAADAVRIERWITDLGSEQFPVRQAAAKELKQVGEQVKAPIARAMRGNLSLEARRRLESVLDTIASAVPDPATLRSVRAVRVLEKIGSMEAKQVLETLSKGASGARETLEAQQALAKLMSAHSIAR